MAVGWFLLFTVKDDVWTVVLSESPWTANRQFPKMVGFHSKPLCFCGSDLPIGSQVLHVQDKIRGLFNLL